MGKGLLYALPNLNEAISHPFQIQWTNNTLKSIGLCLLTYEITVGIYLSSSKNYRRNEEYGPLDGLILLEYVRNMQIRIIC